MKLVHPEIPYALIESDNKCSEWIIENPETFSSYLQEMMQQCSGEDGRFVLSQGAEELDIAKNVEVIFDIFSVDCNDRRILNKLYAQLERPDWIVKELGLITNCPLKITTTYKDENGNKKQKKKLFASPRTPFTDFNVETVEKIKEDISKKRGIKVEDVDLSKFIHMRTTLSIPNHKEVVENEMGNFLYRKYPKISIDSVKTIYATILELMTKRQQYELLPDNASYEDVRKNKGVSRKDFSRIIETAMSISIPPFDEILSITNLLEEKYQASFEYTRIMADSQKKLESFLNVFRRLSSIQEKEKSKNGEMAWQYANRMCDLLFAEMPNIELVYNRTYICVLSICILINEMRKV